MSSTFDVQSFTISNVLTCADELKATCVGATSMEDVAVKTVHALYHSLVDSKHSKACVLARFYTTMRYDDLSVVLKGIIRANLEAQRPAPDMKCLTLLGTTGDKPAWNSRKTSVDHQVIALPSPEIVEKSPMISQLMQQFGLDVGAFLADDPQFMVTSKKTYNVFYIPEALSSPYVPAQEQFVMPMKVRSVVGFGGLLPSGNLFAVILFFKISIPNDIAELFKSLALTIRGIALPFDQKAVFLRNRSD